MCFALLGQSNFCFPLSNQQAAYYQTAPMQRADVTWQEERVQVVVYLPAAAAVSISACCVSGMGGGRCLSRVALPVVVVGCRDVAAVAFGLAWPRKS